MQGFQPRLHIGSRAHLGRGADQYAHRAFAHLGKQRVFLRLRVCIVDKGDLVFRDAAADELAPQVVIHVVKAAVRALGAWRGQVAEDHLRQALLTPFPINAQRLPHTGIYLAARVVRQRGVDQPRVQRQQPPIVGDAQHVVLMGVHAALAHCVGALAQAGDHLLLVFAGLREDVLHFAAPERGYGQVEHVRGLYICGQPEHAHQLRQIVELAEARFQAIPRTLRGQFDGRLRLAEGRCPGVEVGKPALEQLRTL